MLRALTALTLAHRHNPASHQGRLAPAIDSIHQRLLVTPNPDGGWGQTPGEDSDPMSTAYTLTALAPTHHTHPTVQAGLYYLLSRQNPDGICTSVSDQAAPPPPALHHPRPHRHLRPPRPHPLRLNRPVPQTAS